MALDVYLGKKDVSLPKSFGDCVLQFEDDGYYWFLYSFFEDLEKQTGQMIDLYEGAFFNEANLDLLHKTIQQVKNQISQKPDFWKEFIGTIIHPGERKVEKRYSTVHKKKLESILAKLENAVIEAKEKRIGILFFGD
jgi:hypothetical protein